MRKLLTDRFVEPTRKSVTFLVVKTRGLALRVGARTKTWCFVYRNGGAPQWFRLGDYPALTLAAARTRVENERAGLNNGVDPAAERRKPPAEPEPVQPVFTFADFVPVFVAFQSRRTKHWEDEHAKIKHYLLQAWGAL